METIRHLRYRQATSMLCSEWYYNKKPCTLDFGYLCVYLMGHLFSIWSVNMKSIKQIFKWLCFEMYRADDALHLSVQASVILQ